MKLGDKIKSHRKALGLSQEEFGAKLGVKKNAVSKWECGRVIEIPTSKLKAMADMFGVKPSYLLDDSLDSPMAHGAIPLPEVVSVPLVGEIACGAPILAEENVEAMLAMPEGIHADFALRCKGDSMINARIFDGDIVFIRQQAEVEDGEIAAVLIDTEATLKRVHIYPDHIVLSPENPQYRPLSFWGEEMANVRILGKAVMAVIAVN